MGGGWIKMRVGIQQDPNVITIAELMSKRDDFLRWMFANYDEMGEIERGHLRDIRVTHNVTVAAVIGLLLRIWAVVRREGEIDGNDMILRNAQISTVDVICSCPGFGAAMEKVGWLQVVDESRVVFPRCMEYMTSPEERTRVKATLRKRKQRDRERDIWRDESRKLSQTCHADVTPRIEKSREEKKKKHTKKKGVFVPPSIEEVAAHCKSRNSPIDPEDFVAYYTARGWQMSNGRQMKDWHAAIVTWEKRMNQRTTEQKTLVDADELERERWKKQTDERLRQQRERDETIAKERAARQTG